MALLDFFTGGPSYSTLPNSPESGAQGYTPSILDRFGAGLDRASQYPGLPSMPMDEEERRRQRLMTLAQLGSTVARGGTLAEGLQGVQQQGLQRLMLNLQVQKQLEDARREKAMQEYLTGGPESQAAQGQAAPSTSTQQALGQTSIQPPASALNPQQRQLLALLPPTERAKALGELLKEKKPLVVGDRVLDPFSYKVLFEAPAKPVVVGNSLVDPTTKQALFTETPQSPNELRVFQAYLGMSPETKKQFRDFRESSTSKTSINVAMDKFAGELGGALAKNVIDGYGDAQAAQRTIQNIQDARTYVPEMFAGTGANVFLAGAKALNAVGFNIPQVKNTEAFRSAIGQVVLPGLKALGSGQAISNSDRQYMERIVAGDITLDRPSIDEVLNIVERTNRRVIDLHNDKAVRAGNLAKEKGLNFDMTIQTQPSGQALQNQLPGQPQVKRRRYDPVTKSLVEY